MKLAGLHIKSIVLCALLAITHMSYAQNELFTQYKFHRLDEKQGLTDYMINDIIQDSLGLIWVATNEGLYRYEGTRFQRFVRNGDQRNSVPNNYIANLYLDDQNNVWLLTDDGIGRYSYTTDKIEPYLPEALSGRISEMAIDKQGNKYFGKLDGGIDVSINDQVSEMNLLDESSGMDFSDHSIVGLAIKGDWLWAVVSDLGIMCFDLSADKITFFHAKEITDRSKSKFYSLKIDDKGRAWIGTETGVFILRIGVGGKKVVNKHLTTVLPVGNYLSTYIDNNNQLWVGSRQNGLFQLELSSENNYQLKRHFYPKDDESGISHRTISTIFQEKEGWFWLGTHNGGVNVFNPQGEKVRAVTKQINSSDYSLNYQNVWGISESRDGSYIWVGTDGKGMSKLDPFTGEVINDVFPSLVNKAVLSALEDREGRLWIGTYAHGIYMKEKGRNRLISFTYKSQNSQLVVNDIRCIYEDEKGTVFFGTNQGGLYYYDEASGIIKHIEATFDLDIRTIISSEDNMLWLGTYGRGVFQYSSAQNRIIRNLISDQEKYSSEVVYDLEVSDNQLYIATQQNGVLVYNYKQDTMVDIPALREIAYQSAWGLQKDIENNLWITINSGVGIYNPEKGSLQLFGANEGISAGHFNAGSIFYSQNGYIAAGGMHGLNLFYPEQLINKRTVSADILFNNFKVYNSGVKPGHSNYLPEDQSIFLTHKVELTYTDNIFSIQYAYPGFNEASYNNLLFKLKGYDEEWQSGNVSNEVTYRNVPPGNYVFAVKSINGSMEKDLAVVIRPPFWKTWPAYSLYFVLIVALFWLFVRYSNSRAILQHKLEYEQELREKEHAIMQDKLRFYTNFSHELKTPLTLIQGPVTDLLRTTDNPLHKKYLSLVRKNTRVILRFVNRMLEFRKIEMNKTILNVGKHDIKILAQEEAESFGYLAKDKGIKFGFYCENDLVVWLDLEKLQIIMNNLLSNAFKFTPKGKHVNFGVLSTESEIQLEVKDEGVGIKPDEISQIFSPFYQASNTYSEGGTGIGLALSKSFVELHHGWIDVESKLGEGTRILVHIPKSKEKFKDQDNIKYVHVVEDDSEMLYGGIQGEEDIANLEAAENEKMLMVVEDNKDIATYIASIFEPEYKVVKAANGLEAYDLAVAKTPNIIVSDLMMPGMDGIAFCQKIKNNISTSHIPVIMVTAKDSEQDKVRGYEVGADAYITKPFSSEVLIARVNSLLKNRQMLLLKYESNELIDTSSTGKTKEVEFVLEAEKMILQMLEESEFSVPLLCRELGMSQSALYRKVKSLTGVSIQVFIRKIRIKRAAQMLLSEDMTVTEIAFVLGFSDLSYFRKCFKEQYGQSPSEYKVAHNKKDNHNDKTESDVI